MRHAVEAKGYDVAGSWKDESQCWDVFDAGEQRTFDQCAESLGKQTRWVMAVNTRTISTAGLLSTSRRHRNKIRKMWPWLRWSCDRPETYAGKNWTGPEEV